MSTQTSELEALEARLRATEERLKAVSSTSPNKSGRSSPHQRVPLGNTFAPREAQTSPLASEFRPTSASRPKSRKDETYQARGLPPTPSASEGESDSEGASAGQKKADTGVDSAITGGKP